MALSANEVFVVNFRPYPKNARIEP